MGAGFPSGGSHSSLAILFSDTDISAGDTLNSSCIAVTDNVKDT